MFQNDISIGPMLVPPPKNSRWRLYVFGYAVRPSVHPLSVDAYFAWCDISVLSGEIFVELELSWVESEYLYTAPNSLISHNGAGRWFTGAGKAESSAGAWRCSATVRGCIAKEVDTTCRTWHKCPPYKWEFLLKRFFYKVTGLSGGKIMCTNLWML